ncbi:heme ABC transporter ATP-binding protein [Natronoglycomyces albus]|uniref:Heme ABC transporter ATP-binding protein n=1 Tax=Natronoglycomyces albus TaxID=2811108 RepID=A0A895XE93_9ACTN|nr:heme ABC transporter ATP-binding protein [Natronoglycomyces albus]QSB04141.1 heme ABC transporter ATP-binding protein [Natronoglycomyces albus]
MFSALLRHSHDEVERFRSHYEGHVVNVRDLIVDRGGRRVLDRVDLTVKHGEVVSLVGPNGAGKSTLLAAICTDLEPTSGDITLYGTPIERLPALEIARRQAVLPQAHTVSFPFTVVDIVRMGRNPWAKTAAEEHDEDHVEAAMARCDVTHMRHTAFNTLSGGEKARVMLARVLAQDTRVLLLDEPTAALDLRHQELVGRTLRELAAQERGIIVVLHDLNLAAAYSDRIVLLDQGTVAASGTPEEVLRPELISQVYQHPVTTTTVEGSPLILPQRDL